MNFATHTSRDNNTNTRFRRVFNRVVFLSIVITLFAMTVPGHAQTEWKDRYVTIAEEDQLNPNIARPSQPTSTIIVWEDNREDSTGVDIYAQKIDNTNGIPMWEPVDGVVVCTALNDQENPRAAYDSLGGVIIVWEDYRNDTTKASIYAQRLNVTNGSVATNWTTNGVAVCDTTAHAAQPRIVGNGDGGYVAWVDWRNTRSFHPDSLNRDIYLQFVKSANGGFPSGGTFAWKSCGVLVPKTSWPDQTNVELARDYWWHASSDTVDRAGVVLVYQDFRAESSTSGENTWNIYSDRYDSDGRITWGDVRCSVYDEEQLYPRIVVGGRHHGVGDSTALIVWQDVREDPNSPPKYDIYAQVLCKHNGTRLMNAAGEAVCDATETQQYPEITLYEREEDIRLSITYLSRVFCAWEDKRDDGLPNKIDVYGAAINGITGAILTPSGTDGEEVCTTSNDQTQVRVDNLPGDEDVYIIWRHTLTGAGNPYSDIYYQNFDLTTLSFDQPAGVGTAVTKVKGEQSHPQVSSDVFVYECHRRQELPYDSTYDWNIFAETPGACVGPTGMGWRDMFAEVTDDLNAEGMRFVVDSAYNTFVVWADSADSNGDANVYIQKFDIDGVPRWQNSGIKLNTSDYATHPDVAISDTVGGAQVVWQQTSGGGDNEILYAKIPPNGKNIDRNYVYDGTKPVIAYSQRTGVTANPRCPAHIALLCPVGTGHVIGLLGYLGGVRNEWRTIATPDSVRPYDDIMISASPAGDAYVLAWGNSSSTGDVGLVWSYHTNPAMAVGSFRLFDELDGCDIMADAMGGDQAGFRDGFAVVCADSGSGNMDLLALRMPANGWIPTQWFPLTYAGNCTNCRASQPSMCSDSATNGNGYGGMLVAWDWEYPATGSVQKHKVQTNKFEFVTTGGVDIHWSDSTIIDVSEPTNAQTYPDIARISNVTPTAADTMSFIVWEGMIESCSPPRPTEIIGQWVRYNNFPSTDRDVQWLSEKAMGPGPGYYTQTRPMVKTSADKTVNVFWYDGRGAADLVMGTRAWAEGENTIFWAKEDPQENVILPDRIRIGANYPNPVSLSTSAVSHIIVETTTETSLTLKLYNSLGREVVTVHDGTLTAGQHILRFDASGLSIGVYYYVLRSTGIAATRGMVVVK